VIPVRIIAVLPGEPGGIRMNRIIEPTRQITLIINIIFTNFSFTLEVMSSGIVLLPYRKSNIHGVSNKCPGNRRKMTAIIRKTRHLKMMFL